MALAVCGWYRGSRASFEDGGRSPGDLPATAPIQCSSAPRYAVPSRENRRKEAAFSAHCAVPPLVGAGLNINRPATAGRRIDL